MSEMLSVKYRPKSWAEVIGQAAITNILSTQIATGKFKQVYLFTGPAGCVDKDTEFFNGNEWKPISNYKEGDMVLQYDPASRTGELVYPTEFIKLPETTMYHIKSNYGMDMCLSDEHRVIYESSKGNINEIRFSDLRERLDRGLCQSNYKFLTTFNFSGEGIPLTDAEIKIMCAVICDGSFRTTSTNLCCLNLKKQRKIDEIRSVLHESGIEYSEKPQKNGYTRFYFYAPIHDKEFTSYWYKCNSHQLKVICDNILNWDGSVSANRKSFSSAVKSTVDFLQMAFASCGYRASISIDDRKGKPHSGGKYEYKSVYYRLNITSRNKVTLPTDCHYDVVSPEDGYKYCFVVPTHMWVMRRNGNIIVTGNCGKTTCARLFAKYVNNNQGSPIEIDAASNNGVDNIRSLITEAQQSSIDCDYKVFIIDEAHQLTKAAWDASLKLIEEPPINSIFIFCTTNPNKIPETIMSRVQRFDFKRVDRETISDRLKFILNEEFPNIEYDNVAIDRIASLADGHVRNALQNLDKCIDCVVDNKLSLDIVEATLGVVRYVDIIDIIKNLCDKNALQCFKDVENIKKSSPDMLQIFDMFTKFTIDYATLCNFGKVEYTAIPSDIAKNLCINKDLSNMLMDRCVKFREYADSYNAESFLRTIIIEICR